MCLLIVLAGVDPDFPVLVASNRDEERARPAAPPGLHVGARRRMLAPRDRRAGGTWIAVNDRGRFAGLTNVTGAPHLDAAPSRGGLPLLALDQDDLDGAVDAVARATEAQRYNAFQLVLSDGADTAVLVHERDRLAVTRAHRTPVVLSNEHRLGELSVRGLDAVVAADLDARGRLDALAPLLLDEGGPGRHRILKKGGAYGTVSSSLIAVPARDLRALIWRYAAGPPDEHPYRDYGNLGRRLALREGPP